MAKLYNLARMTTATTGTGTITLGSAATSYLSFSSAGVQDGDVITYAIVDGNNREIGRGTYTASGTTLSRDTILDSTNAGSAINLSGIAEVFITSAAEDYIELSSDGSATILGNAAVNGNNFLRIPVGSTAQRPASPSTGDTRFNSTTGLVEYYDGTNWLELQFKGNVLSIDGTPVEITTTPYIISSYGLYQMEVLKPFTGDVRIELWGGGGAGALTNSPSRGGAGGYSRGQFTPSVGDTFSAIVGRGGLMGGTSYPSAYPDGAGSYSTAMGGGGGSSRFGPQVTSGNENVTSNAFYLIAGGGAGGTMYATSGVHGGAGGGTNGMDGLTYYSSDGINCTGKGGTQSAGGAAATGGRITGYSVAGSKYAGGRGYGSGGGGGYYGGSGANGYYAMGGGGSGYLDTTTMSNTAMAQATSGSATHYISPDPLGTRPGSAGYGGETGGNVGYDGAIAIYLV